MDKAEIVKVIIEVLTDLQSISGRDPVLISGKTCPIDELAEFDSLNGVEASVELSDRLKIDLPGVNSFVNEQGTKALTVSKIADGICKLTASKES